MGVNKRALLLSLTLILSVLAALPPCVRGQTELGAEDDLTVLGVDGTTVDPDAEIKGFTVFGSTQTFYTGAAAGPGNVVVNGVLAVSSGAYFVGNSTFTNAAKIFINDGSAGQLLGKSAAGSLQWTSAGALGDNLGSHVATTTLQMGVYGVNTSSHVNAAAYQINGSTVLALPNDNSISLGLEAGPISHDGDSIFIGYRAGYVTSGGYSNIFIGSDAGRYNTVAGLNTFIGYAAGYGNITGGENVSIGAYAGYSNNQWGGTYVGTSAGNNDSAPYNTFLGYMAGRYTVAGGSNTVVGYQAGRGASGYSYTANSFYGYQAGYSNRAGGYNTASGHRALYSNTTGSNNSVFGSDAGNKNTTGGYNSFFGESSGYYNNTGNANSFFGYQAGVNNNTGNYNTFMGAGSGKYNLGGAYNTVCLLTFS